MAKIPTILEAGRADGKLIKTNSIYDDNQEKFLSDKIKEIDNNHNNLTDTVNALTDTVNNNELDIENKLEAEQTRATNTENNLRETINNITEISESATNANIVTIDTIPNSSSSNVQQALNELFKADEELNVAIEKEKAAMIGTDRITDRSITISKLSEDIVTVSKNRFNPSDPNVKVGYYLNLDGDLIASNTYIVSGYIPFSENDGSLVCSIDGTANEGGGYCELYDNQKNRITGFISNKINGILRWQTNVAYARFSIGTGAIDRNIQIEKGDTITAYEPYFSSEHCFKESLIPTLTTNKLADGAITTSKIAKDAVTSANIADEAVTSANIVDEAVGLAKLSSEIIEKSGGKNRFNPNDTDVKIGYYINNDGILLSNSNYIVTGYIPFSEEDGSLISSYNGRVNDGGGYSELYDSQKNRIVGFKNELTNGILKWQENVVYARFSVQTVSIDIIQIEQGETITKFETYIEGNRIKENLIPALGNLNNVLQNNAKKINNLNEIVIGNNDTKNIPLVASAYSNIDNINIPSGYTISSIDEYSGDIIFCPTSTFDLSNADNIRIGNTSSAQPPLVGYTFTADYHSCRPTSEINTELVIKINKKGLIEKVNSIKTPYEITPAKVYASILNANTAINIEKNSIKNAKSISFSAKFTTFSSIKIAHGNADEYASSHIIIDSTKVYVYKCYTDKQLVQTLTHGLTIKNNIGVIISCDIMGTASLIVTSNGNIFSEDITWFGSNGNIAATGIDMELNDVVFGFNCYRYNSNIWLFGDSYINLTDKSRWSSYLIKNGYNDILFNAFPGQNSESALIDFNNCISHGKPKIVIWCLGMNDVDQSSSVNSSWLRVYNVIKEKCENLGITLILSTIPNVPSRNNSYKNSIIRSSGLRYIDFYNAVGSTESGSWYDGMLSTDGVHPTEKGAVALFSRAVADVPELMSKA